jgi:hypothetical protein
MIDVYKLRLMIAEGQLSHFLEQNGIGRSPSLAQWWYMRWLEAFGRMGSGDMLDA